MNCCLVSSKVTGASGPNKPAFLSNDHGKAALWNGALKFSKCHHVWYAAECANIHDDTVAFIEFTTGDAAVSNCKTFSMCT